MIPTPVWRAAAIRVHTVRNPAYRIPGCSAPKESGVVQRPQPAMPAANACSEQTGCRLSEYAADILSLEGISVQNRFIMITGSSFGVGKSTLAESLCQRLRRLKIPSRWLSEDDLLAMEAF